MTFMNRNQAGRGGLTVRGIASGVVFLAFFGALWAIIGINGLHGFDENWVNGIVAVIGLALFGGGILLSRRSRNLPNNASQGATQDRQNKNKWFTIVFATEVILILVAYFICRSINRFDLFYPVMMLIVGIHFFPLANLYKLKIYYLTGALLCLVSILTIFIVPEQLKLGGLQISAWWVVLGFCGAFVLWGSGFVQLFRGAKLLAKRYGQTNR